MLGQSRKRKPVVGTRMGELEVGVLGGREVEVVCGEDGVGDVVGFVVGWEAVIVIVEAAEGLYGMLDAVIVLLRSNRFLQKGCVPCFWKSTRTESLLTCLQLYCCLLPWCLPRLPQSLQQELLWRQLRR